MKKVLFILGVFASTLFAQGQVKMSDLRVTNPGDGRMYVEYREDDKPVDGKIRIITGYTTEYTEAVFKNGYPEGKWEYYKDNTLAEVTHYSNGKTNGELIRYYPDGTTVREKAMMKDGKVNGTTSAYSSTGKLTYEKGLVNGVDEGPERKYDDNGTLIYEATYKGGKQEGKSFQIINRGSDDEYTQTQYYKGGKYHGQHLEVFKNGTTKSKGNYIDGQKDGLWEAFKKDGSRRGNQETYKDGKVIKKITYFTDGKPDTEKNYNTEGKQHGIEKKYSYETGKLISEKNFVNGKQVGKQMRLVSSNQGSYYEYSNYNESGKKHGAYREVYVEKNQKEKSKGQYVDDKKHGKWYEGNSLGFYKEETYENGKLIESKDLQ